MEQQPPSPRELKLAKLSWLTNRIFLVLLISAFGIATVIAAIGFFLATTYGECTDYCSNAGYFAFTYAGVGLLFSPVMALYVWIRIQFAIEHKLHPTKFHWMIILLLQLLVAAISWFIFISMAEQ